MGTRLFVDGAPSFFTAQQLKELFQRYGTVLSAEVMRYSNGESLEFGYVKMATPDEASIAISRLNETQLYSQTLMVKLDRSRPDKPSSGM